MSEYCSRCKSRLTRLGNKDYVKRDTPKKKVYILHTCPEESISSPLYLKPKGL